MDDVYVVEIASTGPKGVPDDAVAEVAVCRMFADGSDFDTVYGASVCLDPKDLGKESLDFLEANYGIGPEELYLGEDIDAVVKGLQDAVYGKECTSYNVGNVFGKHLNFEPWDCTREVTILPSISMRLDRDLKGAPESEHLLIREAYERLCPGDPACVGGGRRAMDLAQMAVSVLMRLRREGWYRGQNILTENPSRNTRARHPRKISTYMIQQGTARNMVTVPMVNITAAMKNSRPMTSARYPSFCLGFL